MIEESLHLEVTPDLAKRVVALEEALTEALTALGQHLTSSVGCKTCKTEVK